MILRALLGDKYDDVIRKAAVACADSVDDCFETIARWQALPEDERTNEWAWDEGLDGAMQGAGQWIAEAHKALAAVLPELLADAWDEGHADGLHNAHEYREHRKLRNPYRPETITRDATDAPVTPAAPDATSDPSPTLNAR